MKKQEIIFSVGKIFCDVTDGKLWKCTSIGLRDNRNFIVVTFNQFRYRKNVVAQISYAKYAKFAVSDLTQEQKVFAHTHSLNDGHNSLSALPILSAVKVFTDRYVPVRIKDSVKEGDRVIIINTECAADRARQLYPGAHIRKSESPFRLEGLKAGTIAKAIRWSKPPLGGRPVIMTKFDNPYVYKGRDRTWNSDNYWLHKASMVPIDVNPSDWSNIEVCSTTEQLLKEMEKEELVAIANDTEFISKKSIRQRYSQEHVCELHFQKIEVKHDELEINKDKALLLLV